MKRFGQWIYLVAVCLALTNVGFPQASSSSLRGTVTDPSGSALPGATVVVTSTELEITRTSTTGAVGDYGFPALPPGTYNLTVTATGFARYQQTNIQLLVNTPATANVQLKVGAASENVTVTSEAPVLNLVDASIGNSFGQIQVQQIPLEGRNRPRPPQSPSRRGLYGKSAGHRQGPRYPQRGRQWSPQRPEQYLAGRGGRKRPVWRICVYRSLAGDAGFCAGIPCDH